jgi:hypothetical protein
VHVFVTEIVRIWEQPCTAHCLVLNVTYLMTLSQMFNLCSAELDGGIEMWQEKVAKEKTVACFKELS